MIDYRDVYSSLNNPWSDWIDCVPPKHEIVECRRLGDSESFWVKSALMPDWWNVWGLRWRFPRLETEENNGTR